MTNVATVEQPKPNGKGRDIFPLLIADINARAQKGVETYGEKLRAFNGRDALIDAYHEALDLAVYLRQLIEEREQSAKSAVIAAMIGQENFVNTNEKA